MENMNETVKDVLAAEAGRAKQKYERDLRRHEEAKYEFEAATDNLAASSQKWDDLKEFYDAPVDPYSNPW